LGKTFSEEVVEKFTIPEHLDHYLKETLESRRNEDGSQSCFAAFVLDAVNPIPQATGGS
jgi:hypothetical protein